MSPSMDAYGFTDPKKDQALPAFEKRVLPVPEARNREIVVEVRAVGINPTDLATRLMKKTTDDSFTVLGRDIAGVVVSVGDQVTLFKKGDEVFYPGTSNVQGAQADYHKIDERMVSLKPKNLSFAEAAALPLTALTSYEVIHDRLHLFDQADQPGEVTLLIVGAAGGVGSIATQLALNYGFNVIGTASRDQSKQHLNQLGVQHVIDHSEPYKKQLEEKGLNKIDAVFLAARSDDNILEASKVVKPQGHICSLLPISDPLPMPFFTKSLTISFELMYTRSVYQTDDWIKQHEYLTELKNQVEQGFVQSTLSKRFDKLNEDTLTEAYTLLQSEHTIGKIVLEHHKNS
ncbi:MAG: zinc-binding alcohol dehydrogenase family protein [Alkalibacterium sp.]|nr:zinc-binding alcohol dehydrogenase family protein [Alkalibacterium sp.]